MAAHMLFCNTLTLIVFFMLPNLSTSDKLYETQLPRISFILENYKKEYKAGEPGALLARIYKGFQSKEDEKAFNPVVQMNEVTGNSSLVTGLWFDRNNWKIYFIPIMVGVFNVYIDDDRFSVHSYGNSYHVKPGPIYEPGGIVSWKDQVNEVVAGSKVAVLILPKDAFGNNVTSESEGQNIYSFDVYATALNGSNVNLLDLSNKGWNENGFVCIEFVVVTSGHLSVHIKHKNSSLIGSPLPLAVHTETLDVANCLAHWSTETNSFQLLSRMETFISQRDKFGNLVPGLYEFNVAVMEKGSRLLLPISDLQYKEVSPGIQSWSFTVVKPGDFILIISDKHDNKIKNMPYEFTIYTGYCDDPHSTVYGPGLNDSIAGLEARFTISLRDAYQYPSPIELKRVQVQITLPSLSLRVYPQIHPKGYVNGTHPTGMLGYGAFGPTRMTYVPSDFSPDNSENSKTRSSDFDVTYVPEKTGIYEIRIFCGNIPLNRGHPFIKRVHAAEVNMSTSGVIKFDKKASAGIINNVYVQLLDSFYNPVLYEEHRLKLDIHAKSGKRAFACLFEDLHNGTYEGSYYAYHPGEYELCISYHGRRFSPWPFGIETLDPKEFPSVRDDTADVWEDQSVPINVLENDINFDGKKTISEFQRPSHGSVVQYGDLLRYTPYKGFYGHDKFAYTMVNAHGNTGTAEVTVHVLSMPPQFVSYPKELHADEDTLTPQFGGFPSFEVMYSDPQDNISIILTAENGTVFLSPLLMKLWDPMWIGFSVSKVEGGDERLNITGRLGAINSALKSLQYLGKANHSGVDHIEFSTVNINGKGSLSVEVIVEPVNDPPVINVPKFIILENMKENDQGLLIFDRQRNKFNFSIEDPDHTRVADISNSHMIKLWNETYFRVMFSVEVSAGTFGAKLPAQLISTTEVKVKRSKQWQPLQTFVEISKHFTVNKVSGIRFLGTINECNTLLQHLVYYGDEDDGVFRLRVNDMGWLGCYPDCSRMMSTPLMSEATIHLMRRAPMNSLVAHSLGSVIVVESIVLSVLIVILMFFTCKCVIILVREKKKQAESSNLQLNEPQNSHEKMVQSSVVSPENTI